MSGYPPGTIRDWGGTKVRKDGDGKWREVAVPGKDTDRRASQLDLFAPRSEFRNARSSDLPKMTPEQATALITTAATRTPPGLDPKIGGHDLASEPVMVQTQAAGKVERIRQLGSYSAENRHFYRYEVIVDGSKHYTGVEVGGGRSEDPKDLRQRAVAQIRGEQPEPAPTKRDQPPRDLRSVTHHSVGEAQALVDHMARVVGVPTAAVAWATPGQFRSDRVRDAGGYYVAKTETIQLPAVDPKSADLVAHEFAHHVQHVRGTEDGNKHGRPFHDAYAETARAARRFYGISKEQTMSKAGTEFEELVKSTGGDVLHLVEEPEEAPAPPAPEPPAEEVAKSEREAGRLHVHGPTGPVVIDRAAGDRLAKLVEEGKAGCGRLGVCMLPFDSAHRAI